MRYRFIDTQRPFHRLVRLCAVLGVSRSGYCAWRTRPISARHHANARLLAQMRQLHAATKERYGAVKLWRALTAEGIACGLRAPSGGSLAPRPWADRPAGATVPHAGRASSVRTAGPQPCAADLHGPRAESPLGRGSHRHRHPRRLAVPGRPASSLFSARDQLGHECDARQTGRRRRPSDGAGSAAARSRPNPAHRSRGRSTPARPTSRCWPSRASWPA